MTKIKLTKYIYMAPLGILFLSIPWFVDFDFNGFIQNPGECFRDDAFGLAAFICAALFVKGICDD